MVYDFKKDGLSYPEEKQRGPLKFECFICKKIYLVPAQIMNMRVVLAYDPAKIREEP
jgi:hypothetical protein